MSPSPNPYRWNPKLKQKEKQCPHCKNWYSPTHEFFAPRVGRYDYSLQSWCRICEAELKRTKRIKRKLITQLSGVRK